MSKIDEIRALGYSEEFAQAAVEIAEQSDVVYVPEEVETVVPVECYSRVVGYFRPVSQWNKGKRSEFEDRVPFDLGKIVAGV
jgi:anaerobic ribonucleoside-triphosphate reductase